MDWELIWWIVMGFLGLCGFCFLWALPSDSIEVTDRKKKEWEKEWP
jgi:drug/metabolite transporter (DMT)-like permease